MTHVIIQHLRSKPGYISSIGFFTCVMGFNFYYAPKIENPQTRYACAGVSATLFQEILMHSIDTLNMKAKALDAFFSSIIAELVSLVFYYPFDLIKTRIGTLDAFMKIYNEKQYQEYGKFLQSSLKFTNFFKGMFLYSLTYATYVAFSFSLFESFLLSIENFREELRLKKLQDKIKNLKDQNQTLDEEYLIKLKEEYGIIEGKKSIEHSRVDIVLASFTSGCIAGLITNPIEYLAVKKQIDENFSIKKAFQRKGIVYDMLVRGNLLRCTYNGLSSITFFLFFQELCLPMNVDITMYDE
ncbi:UNKNOWN [Stylonychia lemnae]|uniref:Mitochondrial carrier protein n=1 Tax=Stylonychia lemnae TaxID=5949 RepID=A0A078B420_STYLE|nr:UNKNOWN [Stylonychia lemnae]|eukprot:CDW88258.1 UNKNOWN [Stylonychia lemnae]